MITRNELNPTPELNADLAKMQMNMVQPTKTKNGHFGKYADLSDIDNAVRLAIKTSNVPITYTQSIIEGLNANGKREMQVVTNIIHSSGEFMQVEGLPVETGSTP